jgi:hypothetical protein
MAKRRAKKKSKKSSPTVTLRMANPARRSTMAKRAKKRKSPKKRRNPSNPARRGKGSTRRRRRSNPGSFSEKMGQLAMLGAAAVATSIVVTVATAKIYPGKPLSLYGIPALVFLGGVAVSRSMPKLGVGIAAGAFAPFALPLASKALTAMAPAAPAAPAVAAAGIGRSMRQMSAVHMGRTRMGAIDMGAVNLHYR